MKKIVAIKGVNIGEGMPKICVPMVGKTLEELVEEARILINCDSDIIEWRADFFENVKDLNKVFEALKLIREILVDKPIIFTFRSAKEGGNNEVSFEFYFRLNKYIANTGLVDIIDFELFNDEKYVRDIIDIAHTNGVAVIISNHDFYSTPLKEEIISRLCKAQELGGDISKIAVMPQNSSDVITLLEATNIMNEKYAKGPIITMSMAGRGVISRISGEIFGSDLTFGAVKKVSAPGQISASDLRKVIELLHKNL